ncbi:MULTISPECIES: FimV/HubP family polar landmark protein [unclassified Pseudomonas]|uniref:FimV/HubP family polar landmark protein n=1 Tax=unclassified Pseudomonas TaxID=196821 RepID=UPI000C2F8D2A|nr:MULTISPECIES: FimV/HubP family polar landmark protein [unclassified Pseudomonas]
MLESLQSALRCSIGKSTLTRARLLAMLAGGLLYSALAPAMGLGDITLHSALNQPLNAEIALIEPGDLADGELSVSLATPEEFSRAGVERVFFLNDLRFTPVLRGNSSVIQVQSNKPVSEPFLNFLVQVNRPNGRLLREYTVLLDPPGNLPAGYSLPARSAAPEQPASVANIPPPPALQGKHYTVVKGDNPWVIAKRLREAGSQASVNELSQGIRALNPGSDRLRVGQSLLLPDVAVVATPASSGAPTLAVAATATAAAATQNAVAAVTETAQNAEELAKAALENQQLQKTVEDLQVRLKAQDEMIASSQKQSVELQTQLAELKTKAAAPAPAVVAAPVVLPTPATETVDGPNWLLWGAVLLLIALLAVAFILRRNRQQAEQAPGAVPPVAPPPEPMVSRVVTPAQPTKAATPAPTRIEPVVAPAVVASRQSSEVPDALEGVSIYIAYGRFSEAAGILREAMLKEPERTDLHLRLLDVLAQQGDSAAYATEERKLLEAGFNESALQELRAKYPKLQSAAAAPVQAPAAASPAAVLAAAGAVAAATSVLAAHWNEPAEETTATAPVADKPLEDEFQLNLDDLSMDADWDLVSPFDNTPHPRSKTAEEPVLPVELEPEPEPIFTKSFNELPEVFEMPDEQFLSDFSELESEPAPAPVGEVELSLPEGGDSLDDAFLDGFMSDSEPLDIEPLEVDFDSLELEQASASKLERAQTCINVGDLDHASQLLLELLREGDEPLKQTARSLLASIR